MAKNAATGSGTGNQVIGKVFIIYGTVKAVATDGTVRILAPNSPVFADEKIITDSDGSVSIMFDGPPPTQLDLGRMTEIVLDEDVYAGATPEVVTEATAEAEKIQEALLKGETPIELEATAAGGGAAGAGGGHPIVMFDLTGNEVTPGSGADTSGITTTSPDTLGGVFGVTGAPYTGVVTLTATESISEDGGPITYTATVDNAPQGSDLVLTLNNGAIIIIPAGQTTGSTEYTPAPDPDVYVDQGTITGDIVSAQGGGYTELTLADTVTTAVLDSIDTTTVTLSAPEAVTENADGVTFTVTLSNPGETAVTVHTDLGDIVIAAGETQGTLFVSTADPDVYVDPDSITATVTGVDGGNYEAVDYSQASATAQITDTIDTTTVTLSAPESVTENADGVTFTVTLSNPGETAVTVHTDQGDIVIAAGETQGTLFVSTADPDVYVDPSSITATVTGVDGGNYEAVDYSQATATTSITDTIDITTVDLSLSPYEPIYDGPSDGNMWTITAEVDNAPQNTDLVLTLSNGSTITIAVGDTTGTSDPFYTQGGEEISIVSATGGNYEDLDYSGTVVGPDDQPEAYDNVNEVQEGASTPITGNVLTDDPADYQSADMPNHVVAGTFTGSLGGTLVLQENGSYEYTAPAYVDHDLPANDGNELPKSEEFTYTLVDEDGDASQATLTIAIGDTAPETTEGESQIFFVQELAGNDSEIGTYEWDGVNPPVVQEILIDNTNDHSLYGSLGNIAAGAKLYITSGGHTYYMDTALNTDGGGVHFVDGEGNPLSAVPESGEIHIEDTAIGGGDGDYNDVVLRVEQGPTVSEANLSDSDGTGPDTAGTDPDTAALTVGGNLYTSGKIIPSADPLTLHVGSESLALDGSGDSITVHSDTGDLTIYDNGDWSYTLTHNTLSHTDNDPGLIDVTSDGDSDRGAADQVQDVFDLTVTDIDGDSITPSLVININDDGPVAVDDSATQETTNEAFTINAFSNDVFGADGVDIHNSEIVTYSDAVKGDVSYNAETGLFTYAPHEGAEGTDSFTYTITDGDGDKSTATVSITLQPDSVPTAYDNYASGNEGTTGSETANLVLVLDSSGSINDTELQLMKDAITHLMENYDSALGKVMLVDFDDSARVLDSNGPLLPGGNVWMTCQEALDQLDNIHSGGYTDYDDAIAAVRNHYNDNGGPPDADHTYVYFLSDGEPTSGDWNGWNYNPNTISVEERAAWETFLNTHGIDEVYAVGVGMGTGGEDALNTVAWSLTGNQADNVFPIDSFDDLDATLIGTVTPPQDVTGNVITDDDTLGGGADTPGADGWASPNLLVSVEYEGATYTFTGAGDSVTFNLISGAKVAIEADGDYIFTPATDVSADVTETVTYTIQDSDGSMDHGDLHLTTLDLDSLVDDPGAQN